MNPDTDINLVDLMDGYVRLYAPIFTKLLDDYPDVPGIGACIGREKPSACPKRDDGSWYGNPEFETRAGRELLPLVGATMTLQESCRVTAGRRNPVSVSAERSSGGEILVQVSVSNQLGSLFAQRIAMRVPEFPSAFFVTAARITMATDSRNDATATETLSLAAKDGFASAVHAAVAAEVLHNQYADDVDTWLEAFPLEDDKPVSAEIITERFSHWTVVSAYKPSIIIAPKANGSDISALFPHATIEPLELEDESFTACP